MNKIELLAPAGNLEKAKIALLYGADAVYVGGKKFSLRARASNFEVSDIQELCRFAKELNKKVYITMNIIPHNEDFTGLEEYLLELQKAGVDAIITSSLYIIKTAQRLIPSVECHVSTQMSITNSSAVKYWEAQDVKRVVLAREVTLDELSQIMPKIKVPVEIFIHGGMCASYSGRCVLSNYFTSRDANRGGCAHSCRWNYTLFNHEHRIGHTKQFYNMGSKDLMAISYIPRLIDLGVASLKIEGRMKSTYYLATVIRCYRKAIDWYYEKGKITEEELEWLEKEINKAENRMTNDGFYRGIVDVDGTLYDDRAEHPTKEYIGYVLDYDSLKQTALIEQRNYFEVGDQVEFFGPNLDNQTCVVEQIIDAATGLELTVARHPLQQLLIKVPFELKKDDMMRKVK